MRQVLVDGSNYDPRRDSVDTEVFPCNYRFMPTLWEDGMGWIKVNERFVLVFDSPCLDFCVHYDNLDSLSRFLSRFHFHG